MQGTWVQSLAREDPTCLGAAKPRAPQLLSRRIRARLLNKEASAPQGREAPIRGN